MTRQNIGIGSAANDGNGDTLRQAGTKINANFAEVYAFLGGGDSSNLSTQISLENDAVVFEGTSANDFETVGAIKMLIMSTEAFNEAVILE